LKKGKRPVGKSWRVDETYIKVNGQWQYLYRTVDKDRKTVDFLLRARRDKIAARRYFEKSIAQNGVPETVTIDKSGTNLAVLKAINADRETPIRIRQLRRRAGPSGDQATYPPHAWVQEFPGRTHPAWRHRGGAHDRQGEDERQQYPTNFR
jgi:putative transposase